MKEFNFEAAKKGAPVQTRDGKDARILCFDKKHSEFIVKGYPIVALVITNNHEELITCDLDGRYCGKDCDHSNDLMMKTAKKEGWVNIYRCQQCPPREGLYIFESKKEAEAVGKRSEEYITTTHIEWEE